MCLILFCFWIFNSRLNGSDIPKNTCQNLIYVPVVSHTVGVVVWVAEKEKEKSDMFGLMGVEDLPGKLYLVT